eukprot:2480794-Lingulodinium_polyedra.AAC.1
MGWTWALHFCQEAFVDAVREALGPDCLVQEGAPAPRVQPGRPVASVYVDNCCIVGYSKEDTQAALDKVLAVLDARGLGYHEVVLPCKVFETLGVQFDLPKRQARQTAARAWRLYRGLRCLRRRRGCRGKHFERILGHIVNYFMLERSALSAIGECYRFLERVGPDDYAVFGAALTAELE